MRCDGRRRGPRLSTFLVGLIFLAAGSALSIRWLPTGSVVAIRVLEHFRGQSYSSVYHDRYGKPLAIVPVPDEAIRREYARLGELPPELVAIFLGAEDQRFYRHRGWDPLAVIRATLQNVQQRRIVSGASTITMQLVRLGGVRHKTSQARAAVQLERLLHKDTLLELYLSNVPFGYGVAGVRSGARRFFGVPPQELRTAEMLALAVIPRSPARYHPHRNRRENARAAAILAGRLGYDLSVNEIESSLRNPGNSPWPRTAPHLTTWMQGAHGTRVETTLDAALQVEVAGMLRHAVAVNSEHRIGNGAALVTDGRTGEILAWVGSPDFEDPRGGQIDAVRIRRQPGSTLKPFLYAAALDRGYTAATVLPDLPLEFPGAGGGEGLYAPLNYDRRFRGPVRLRTALAASLNVPAIHTLERMGLPVFLDVLNDLGFSSLEDNRRDWGLGLALGNGEVTLLELVQAYTVFLNQGSLVPVRVTRTGTVGGVSPGAVEPQRREVFSPAAADVIRDILADPVAGAPVFGSRGTNREARMQKTGTADQFSNIWAITASSRYVVGVWMGNVTGETVVGRPGSSIPADLGARILDLLPAGDVQFPPLAGVERVRISPVSGLAWTSYVGEGIQEYVPLGTILPEDDWHQPDGTIRYPAMYRRDNP